MSGPQFNWDWVDKWAINVVVFEGKPMALSTEEKIIAVHRMTARGLEAGEIAERLHINDRLVHRYRNLYHPPEHLLRYDYSHGQAMSQGVASMTG